MDQNAYRAALAMGILGSLALLSLAIHVARGEAQSSLFFGPAMSQKRDEYLASRILTRKPDDAVFNFYAEERRACLR
jgi:hypothetical protein